MLRLFGIPESEIAETLRDAERAGVELERLEITTCLRRRDRDRHALRARRAGVRRVRAIVARAPCGHALLERRHDGRRAGRGAAARTARALRRARSPSAESCTGGLLAARLTDLPGASEYVLGGIVAYSNEVKVAQVGVPRETIERHGAVSEQVAVALAEGARARLGADVGVGITGIAGPGGGTPEKPVGTVCVSVIAPGASRARAITLPGSRQDIRERATTARCTSCGKCSLRKPLSEPFSSGAWHGKTYPHICPDIWYSTYAVSKSDLVKRCA